jgi:uncharacterized membrane protein YkvA (DUF1232 family)
MLSLSSPAPERWVGWQVAGGAPRLVAAQLNRPDWTGAHLRGRINIQPRLAATVALAMQPLEENLSVGSMHLLRTLRRWIRRIIRTVSWSLSQWADWSSSALGIVLVALLAPLFDRQLLQTWRVRGFAAFRASVVLALAVYVRLLFDRRAPTIGKVLLFCSILYGVGPGDLLPDRITVLGLVDDLVAVGLASRVFTRLCPYWLVEEHAVRAARAWDKAQHARLAAAGAPLGKSPPPLERQSS